MQDHLCEGEEKSLSVLIVPINYCTINGTIVTGPVARVVKTEHVQTKRTDRGVSIDLQFPPMSLVRGLLEETKRMRAANLVLTSRLTK